ncbi:MAG: hypothetical protein CML17_07320 [Pusillimonas sp.]|nr:hypothetical protein [Pusillimonas sp.]
MNIIDIQDQLKNFSEQQLVSEMQSPTGSAPQFLVLSEIKRRKRVRDDFMKREAAQQPTVAQEAVASAGVPQSGIAGMAEAMAPRSLDAQQNMRSGGLVQFGREIQRGLAEKAQNEQIEPFLDEVEQMAQTEFGVDSASFGPSMSPMPTNIRPMTPSAGLASLSPFGATKTGGKGGAMLGMNRMATLRAQSNPVTELQVIPKSTMAQKYDEGGVVRAANGLPLGLRQNNPGNIRPGAGFIGETGQSGGYAEFGSEEEGLRALARLLGTYSDKYGINTLRGLTSRYAPRSDNKESFDNYVSYLSDRLGMDPDQEFDLKSMRGELIPAIVGFEQGREFGDRYSDDQISRAITAAGTDDEAAVRNALFGVNPREVSTTQPESPSLYESRSPGRGSTKIQTPAPEAAAFSGYPSQRGITALPAGDTSDGTPSEAEIRARADQMKRDAGLGEYKTIVPNLGGSGVVIQDIGDVAEAAERNAQTAQSQVITSAEQGVAPAQLADLADDAGEAVEKAAIVQAQQKDIQANNAKEAAKTKMRQAEAAKTKEAELRDIAEDAPPSVAAGLLQEADALAAEAAQLTEQAGQDNTEGAALEAAATEQRESKKPNPGTAEVAPQTESSEVERGEGDDETAADSDEPNVTFSNRSESDGAPSSLQQEILDLQKRLERDRDTDKYLALAQAGLALMSSTNPTLLGAAGEAGISGLQAYREAQDRYAEGVVDLINARAKLAKGDDGLGAFKGDAGNAVTRLGQIERALGGADGMTLTDEERTRLLQERRFLQRIVGVPEYTTGATPAAPAS